MDTNKALSNYGCYTFNDDVMRNDGNVYMNT